MKQIELVPSHEQTWLSQTQNPNRITFGNYSLENLIGQMMHLWIGCNDINEEGNWQHCPSKGNDTKAYENWADGEPNDLRDGEDCGVQIKWRGGTWNDNDCENSHFAVCELPVSSGGRLTPQCLLHHAMEEFMGEGVGSCGKACRSHPRCHCFNLPKQAGGKMVCL